MRTEVDAYLSECGTYFVLVIAAPSRCRVERTTVEVSSHTISVAAAWVVVTQ